MNSKGKVLKASQVDAISYCLQQGNHLPSAREWALFGVSNGEGIYEFSQFKDHSNEINCTTGCYNTVISHNSDGTLDIFALYPWSYNNLLGSDLPYQFWSSDGERSARKNAYYFDGYSGDIYYSEKRKSKQVVVCAPGPSWQAPVSYIHCPDDTSKYQNKICPAK